MGPNYVTGGSLRIDTLSTHDGEARSGLPGGNALYAAVGAALWRESVGVWARVGNNYPQAWLTQLSAYGLADQGVIHLPEPQDHRTFYAYLPDGRRDDANPAAHFARINQPLPSFLQDYVHSTLGQDDPVHYEPLALRPDDWPTAYAQARAVHLSPLSICTHRDTPPFLRAAGMRQITVDPGERYMTPALAHLIRHFLPSVTAFLPSDQEIRSLFGAEVDQVEAARTLAAWGAPLVVIKRGADGVLLYEREPERVTELAAFHAPGDPRVIDVTGAGDAFCGGFMVGLDRTGDPRQAACYGLASASLVIEGYGALYAFSRDPAAAWQRLDIVSRRSPM
ncbi:MAG: hypothetical protein Fur0021_37640 [Candidatus Promineifilaceae bacterium]